MNKQATQILEDFKPDNILESMTGEDMLITSIDPIEDCGTGSLVFVDDSAYVNDAIHANPAAIVTRPELVHEFTGLQQTAIFTCSNVKLAQALLTQAYVDRNPHLNEWPQIHPSAIIHESAGLMDDVVVGPGAVIGRNVQIGHGTVIMANAVIEEDTRIGKDCVIHANVVIGYASEIGNRVVIKAGCIIGMEGYGFAQDKQGKSHRIPQLGKVIIEDDVLLGANCNVDRATFRETRIRSGCKFDALCHIAHNVDIGEDTLIVAQTGIAGSTRLGKRVIVSGQTAITDHVEITDDVVLVQRAGVINDIDKPGIYAGTPVQPVRDYFKNIAVAHKLTDIQKRLRKTEKDLASLTAPDKES